MDAVQKLKNAADEAYKMHPTSCSHAGWYVIKQYLPDQGHMPANALMPHLRGSPRWKPVAVSEIDKYANQGVLVVGGLENKSGNGHVVVVYPGTPKMSGGYKAVINGEEQIVRPRGPFARCMSTSISRHWPGAMSNGDKTVWDPWEVTR
jgi:hypothetical protein